MKFPIIRPDLPPVHEWAGALEEAYQSRRFSNFGSLSRRLESWFAAEWGTHSTTCVLTSSGTAAIAAPLIAIGVSGRVLLPAFTFPATMSAIKMAGATPVLMDVCPDDWRVSAGDLDHAFATTGAKAAIVLCPFGLRSDFCAHARVARKHGGILIIDNASGLGVSRTPLESSPHVFETYSLHATKPFAIGEGGVIFANQVYDTSLRKAINFGLPASGEDGPPTWGINGKISEFHAAIGLAVASSFKNQISARRAIAAQYMDALAGFSEVSLCQEPVDGVWQFFPLLLPNQEAADTFQHLTRLQGMEIRRYYRPSLSSHLEVERIDACLVSQDLSHRMCCVPVYANASKAEADEMIAIVLSALQQSFVRK